MPRTALLALLPFALAAQPAPPLEFEVASIKLIGTPRGLNNTTLNIAHGRLHTDYSALRQIIGLAYGIQRVRVEGGPAWMDSDLYIIDAKAEDSDATPDQVREMTRTLLADRFKLAVHHGTKQLPSYTLAVAKNGPKLAEAKEPVGKPVVTPAKGQHGLQLVFQNMSVAGLVNTLANYLGSPVLDQTGLSGRYNFTLEWSPATRSPQPDTGALPQAADPGLTIFDALQDQLGLKLEGKKVPVDILIVDHAEKATGN